MGLRAQGGLFVFRMKKIEAFKYPGRFSFYGITSIILQDEYPAFTVSSLNRQNNL